MAAPGTLHMAIDAWLLDQHLHHGHPPTLRFYTWNPPAISLGYSQRRSIPDHWQHLRWQGKPLDLVQRPTGGRGVLHQGDLTYAVICAGLPGNREHGYRHLCQFLIQGWGQLGVDLTFGTATRSTLTSHHCFGLSTAADLVTATGLKWIGSAQLRRGGAILQHGSMRLNPDPDLYAQVFQTPVPEVDRWPTVPPIAEVIATLTGAAATAFDGHLIPQPLSPAELSVIQGIPPGAIEEFSFSAGSPRPSEKDRRDESQGC